MSPGFPNGNENIRKTMENHRKQRNNLKKLIQKSLKIAILISMDSLKGAPRSQEPWVSKWKGNCRKNAVQCMKNNGS